MQQDLTISQSQITLKKKNLFYFNPHFPLNNKLLIPLQTDEVPILQATHCG